MPWRFRYSIKILPGVRWNLGKKGSSVTVGRRGLKVTVGHGQVRETIGIPGTGLSYTNVTPTSTKRRKFACCPLALLLLPLFAVQGIFHRSMAESRQRKAEQPETAEGAAPPNQARP